MPKAKTRKIGVGGFKSTPEMHKMLTGILDSGIISYGPKSKLFERRFADYHDATFSILANSGTSALQVAVQAMKETHFWNEGSKVLVPATTFVASPNVLVHNGLVPRFVDVSEDTFNLDENLIVDAVTEDTVAIMPVHLFGQPCNMSVIKKIALEHNLKIIEDSCETMFVKHEGVPVGSWGDIACFSTYVAHIIVTGVGGISLTNNPRYAGKMRSLVNHGLKLDFLNLDDNFSPSPTPGRRFRFDTVGHSFRITELEAGLGLCQLDTWKENIATRTENAEELDSMIWEINKKYSRPLIKTQITPPGTGHAHMMFPMVLENEALKEPLLVWLNARGIETRDMLPIISQPAYSWVSGAQFPVSNHILKAGLYVGCHQYLSVTDMTYIANTIEDFFKQHE